MRPMNGIIKNCFKQFLKHFSAGHDVKGRHTWIRQARVRAPHANPVDDDMRMTDRDYCLLNDCF